jgi:hypothetical protein
MPPLSPGTAPGGGAPITRTFAAREDIVEWTRKLASLPPPASTDPGEGSTPRSPPPSVVDADEPATRALPRSAAPARVAKRFPWAVVGSGGAALVVLGLAALRGPAPPEALSLAPPRPSEAAAVVPAVSVGAVLPVVAAAPSGSVAIPSNVRSAKAAPSASADAASAQLRLTADPSATVTIVGGRVSQTHVTPVRGLKLPPGTYSVTFRSPTFGEPVVAQVALSAASSRGVHADFRAAIPTVSVR